MAQPLLPLGLEKQIWPKGGVRGSEQLGAGGVQRPNLPPKVPPRSGCLSHLPPGPGCFPGDPLHPYSLAEAWGPCCWLLHVSTRSRKHAGQGPQGQEGTYSLSTNGSFLWEYLGWGHK